MDLATRVKDLRNAKGWSQVELAKAAGVSQQTIGKIENGKSLKPRYLPDIAVALGKTVEQLLDGLDRPRKSKIAINKASAEIVKLPRRAGWPFKVDPRRYEKLSKPQRREIEALVFGMVIRFEGTPPGKKSDVS